MWTEGCAESNSNSFTNSRLEILDGTTVLFHSLLASTTRISFVGSSTDDWSTTPTGNATGAISNNLTKPLAVSLEWDSAISLFSYSFNDVGGVGIQSFTLGFATAGVPDSFRYIHGNDNNISRVSYLYEISIDQSVAIPEPVFGVILHATCLLISVGVAHRRRRLKAQKILVKNY